MTERNKCYSFIPYEDMLVLLYLYTKNIFSMPMFDRDLPVISEMPFLIDFTYGDPLNNPANQELHNNQYSRKDEQTFDMQDIRRKFERYGETLRLGQQYLMITNRPAFKNFIDQYIAWYETGNAICNTSNELLFEESYNHTIKLLQNLQQHHGDYFNLTNKEVELLPSNQTRWPEILLKLVQSNILTIEPQYVKFPTKSQSAQDSPTFSFMIRVLQPFEEPKQVIASSCGIQITEDNQVCYKGYNIPFNPKTSPFAILRFLLRNQGEECPFSNIPPKLIQAKSTKNTADHPSSSLERMNQYIHSIRKAFEKSAQQYGFSIDFEIYCGKKGISLHPKTPKC